MGSTTSSSCYLREADVSLLDIDRCSAAANHVTGHNQREISQSLLLLEGNQNQ